MTAPYSEILDITALSLNIPRYRDHITLRCGQYLTPENINAVANMLALTEALKSQNYQDGSSEIEPENPELVAEQYAANLFSYVSNPKHQAVVYDQHNKNWIALFSAAVLGNEAMELSLSKKQDQQHESDVAKPKVKAEIKKMAKLEHHPSEMVKHSETLSIQYMHGSEELHVELTACEMIGSASREQSHQVLVHKNKVVATGRQKAVEQIDIAFSDQDKRSLQAIMQLASIKSATMSTETGAVQNVNQDQFAFRTRQKKSR